MTIMSGVKEGCHLEPFCYWKNKGYGWESFVALVAENRLCNSIQAAATCLKRSGNGGFIVAGCYPA